MNTVPTNAEVAFYVIFAVIAVAAILILLIGSETHHDRSISDVDAWLRNYNKLQNR